MLYLKISQGAFLGLCDLTTRPLQGWKKSTGPQGKLTSTTFCAGDPIVLGMSPVTSKKVCLSFRVRGFLVVPPSALITIVSVRLGHVL